MEELERELDKLDGGNRSQRVDSALESRRSMASKRAFDDNQIQILREQKERDAEEMMELRDRIREKEVKELEMQRELVNQVREAEEKAEDRINEAKARYDDHLKKLEHMLESLRAKNKK